MCVLIMFQEIKEIPKPVCSSDQSGDSSELWWPSGEDESSLFSPSPSESVLLNLDTSYSQRLHQQSAKRQTEARLSLSAWLKWDRFVQGEGASWAVMGYSSQAVFRNK